MGHNTTRQAAAGHVRMQLLSVYADWILVARCQWCDRQAGLWIDTLPQHWRDGTVAAAIMRQRSSSSGTAATWL